MSNQAQGSSQPPADERRAAVGPAIRRASAAILGCDDVAAAAAIICRACKEFVGAESGYVQAIEGDEGTVIVLDADTSRKAPFIMPAWPLAERARTGAGPICLNTLGARLADSPLPEGHPQVENVLGVPLMLDGDVVGLMTLANKPGGFDEVDVEWAGAFGEIMALAVSSIRLRDNLKTAACKLRLLFDGARDAIFWADAATGTLIDCNEAAERLLGHPRDTIVGLHQSELHLTTDNGTYLDGFRDVVTKVDTAPRESAVITADMRVVPVEISTSLVDAGGVRIVQRILRDITQRKVQEQLYRSLFERMIDGLALHEVVFDEHGRPADCHCVAVNPAFEKLMNLRAEDIVGRCISELAPDTDSERLRRCLHIGAAGPDNEFEDVWEGGSRIVAVKVYSPAAGQFATIFSDVTERIQAENALKISEARLRMAQEAAGVATWEWDLNTGRHQWSDNMWKMSGLDPAEHDPSHATWLLSLAPEERECADKALARCVESSQPFSLEYRVITCAVSERWLATRGAPVFGDDGVASHYVGVVIDVTQERRVRNHLTWTRRKLDEAHRIARIGVWEWTVETGAVVWSESLYRMLEMDPAEPAPTWEQMHTVCTAEGWRMLQALVAETLETGRPYDVEFPMVRADGSTCWTRLVGSTMVDDQGTAIGLHGTVHDISERKLAQDEVERQRSQLRELAAELARAGERERRQAALDLHDGVGQTLAAAKMLAQQVRSKHDDNRDIERLLELIDHSIAGVRGLTNELSPPVLYELGLAAALSWLVESYQERFGLSVTLRVDPGLSTIKGESGTLAFRIARELLMNVHRHSGVSEATLRATLLDDTIALAVRDRGKGFDSIHFHTHTADGFGLFSVREEVRLAGGTVEIDAAPNRGAYVDVRIPAILSTRMTAGHANNEVP